MSGPAVQEPNAPTLLWFRRDLRLNDNPALAAARDYSKRVIPVFVVDPLLWGGAGGPRRALLAGALRNLHEELDGKLVVLHGDPVRTIVGAARAAGAAAVHISEEFTPHGRQRDEAVRSALDDHGIALVATGSPYAVSPGRVRKPDGSPYRVFTPFSRAWREHGWRAPAPSVRAVTWADYDGPHRAALPDPGSATTPVLATEAAARQRWQEFRDGPLADYARDRNPPGLDATSRLSPYLHLGLLHPRTLLADMAERTGKGVEVFRNELCWREFYADVLAHQPASAWESLDPRFTRFPWNTGRAADEHFAAWAAGQTGYPIVDAGMRQLLAEGWMHNRVRMITASFLVKDLHLDWRRGARHFLDHLVDGDVASNQHGWQWVAGSGTDAAPYFRVFNPTLQSRRYDPDGDYVRRYVPELAGITDGAVHEPWTLSTPPAGYPAPIVDHHEERAEALRRYEATAAGAAR